MIGNRLNDESASRPASCELSERLEARGWRVVSASSRRHRMARLADMLGTTWRARRDYDVAQVDVFGGAAFRFAEAVTWLLRRLGKRTVLMLRGGSLPELGQRQPRRMRRLLDRADAVITPSRYLQRSLGAYRRDIAVIPNAVDVADHHPRVRSSPRPRLVWLRAFHAIYNPLMAVAALHELHRAGHDATLVMAGPDKHDGSAEAVRHMADNLSMTPFVTFAGKIPKRDVPGFMREADIFLNTADVDNTPVTVIEAMASGLCIVSTSVGGVPDLVTDGRDGLLVPAGDARAMAAAVVRILSDRALAKRLSIEARRTAESFDWPATLDQWERTLIA